MTRLFLAAVFGAITLPVTAYAGSVEVRLTGARPGGPVLVLLCAEAEGLMRCARQASVPVRAGAAVARFENVPAGRYGVAAFQDVNSNGRLGFDLMGRPNEPWGYSRGARGVFGPPEFPDAAMTIPTTGAVVQIQLGT